MHYIYRSVIASIIVAIVIVAFGVAAIIVIIAYTLKLR